MENEDDGTVKLKVSSLSSQAACPERYEIRSLVGHGGMGMVFHAIDKELSRDVAIKVLFFDGAREPDAQERFMREAHVLGILNHPNIVRIFSSGLNAHGNPYHVMEYIKGVSLSHELSNGALSAKKFYSVISQILAGLAHAHENKIAHRDLKPSNIMHCQDADSEDLYKIIDFGIARVELSKEQAAKTITRTDAVLGSPLYISPEQCRSARGDSLSDIYSLGCIMYECISGKPPIKGDTAFETMYKHMAEAPARLDTNTKSPISIQLASLIARCLEKDPAARPQSVLEISTELAQIFNPEAAEIDLFANQPTSKAATISLSKPIIVSALILSAVVATGIYFYKTSAPPSKDFKRTSSEEKNAKELEKQKAKVERRWKNTSEISENSAPNYINDLLALGRDQLAMDQDNHFAEAEKTYSDGVSFCEKYGDKFIQQEAAFLTLKAKAETKQKHFEQAKLSFEKAFQVVSQLAPDAEIKIDMLRERAFYHIAMRDFDAGLTDSLASAALYDKNDKSDKAGKDAKMFFALDRIAHIDQALDPKGKSRWELLNASATDIRTIKPRSESEAISLVKLSIYCSRRLAKNILAKKMGAVEAAEHAMSLVKNISGHPELSKETVDALREAKAKSAY